MDLNGHVIKFMKDHTVANHAGGKWKGKSSNRMSIGLEIVHKEKGDHEYTDDQYAELLEFLARVADAYSIEHTQVAGHSDVGTFIPQVAKAQAADYDLLISNRDQDPGQIFRWEKLEEKGWGMIPRDMSFEDAYAGIFDLPGGIVLQEHDKDSEHKFGGKVHATFKGTPIQELKQDLADIGYSLKEVNGKYDHYTERAVAAFQRHFFSGSRKRYASGKVDKETAQMIKNVVGGP
jgi:N-acetyl-anhydromuramyl-L-alanine amidase AmpD